MINSRMLSGVTAGVLAMAFVAGSALPAAAQAADAEERCTGDVMRLCSEFVPDRDSIVACLKVKQVQLSTSCLTALLPAAPVTLASQASPRKSASKAGAPLVLVPAVHTTGARPRATVSR